MTLKFYQKSNLSLLISFLLVLLLAGSIYLFLQIKTNKSINIPIIVDKKGKFTTLIDSNVYYQMKKGNYANFVFDSQTIRLEIVKITNLQQNVFEIEFSKSPFLKPLTQVAGKLILGEEQNFFSIFLN